MNKQELQEFRDIINEGIINDSKIDLIPLINLRNWLDEELEK